MVILVQLELDTLLDEEFSLNDDHELDDSLGVLALDGLDRLLGVLLLNELVDTLVVDSLVVLQLVHDSDTVKELVDELSLDDHELLLTLDMLEGVRLDQLDVDSLDVDEDEEDSLLRLVVLEESVTLDHELLDSVVQLEVDRDVIELSELVSVDQLLQLTLVVERDESEEDELSELDVDELFDELLIELSELKLLDDTEDKELLLELDRSSQLRICMRFMFPLDGPEWYIRWLVQNKSTSVSITSPETRVSISLASHILGVGSVCEVTSVAPASTTFMVAAIGKTSPVTGRRVMISCLDARPVAGPSQSEIVCMSHLSPTVFVQVAAECPALRRRRGIRPIHGSTL